MNKNNTGISFTTNSESMEELRKWLEEEEKKKRIRDVREHDFGNGVSYVQYCDEEKIRHTIIHKEQGGGQYSKIHSGGVLYGWKYKIKSDGAEVFTDTKDNNNELQVTSTDKNTLVFDTTKFRGQEVGFLVGKEKEIRFNIKSDGNIELTNIDGAPKNRVFFKNGDKLQTIGENGTLIDVEEIDKQELMEISKGLAGVTESKVNKLNSLHSNRINNPSPQKYPSI